MIYRTVTMAQGQPLVELCNVSKRFSLHHSSQRSLQETMIRLLEPKGKRVKEEKTFWPVQDVSFAVQPGQSVGIIGPNGSGKSTLLKLITGILEPTSGDIAVRGRVSSLLELGAGFHPDLTGRENIYLNGSIFGLTRRDMQRRLDSIIDFAELGDFIDTPIKHYSSGMYVRLGFAVAIHTEPDLLVVDEVLAVGDAAFQHKCMDSIQKFRMNGGTLLLVSHDLSSIQSICKEAIWLDHGKVQAAGKPVDVAMAYLNHVAKREEAAAQVAAHAEPARAPVVEDKQRWGTGRIRFTDVELCDGEGRPCLAFVEGCPMEIRMHYAVSGAVPAPVFGIAIHSQLGAHVCGPNTKFGHMYIPEVTGPGLISYRIPELRLLEGTYLVSVAVTNEADSEMYDYHDRAYKFRVYPGQSGEHYGLVTLAGDWNWQAGRAE